MSDKILIVDDEKEIADLVAFYLESENFEAKVCYTSKEAMEQIQTEVFDMAILDIMLPGIDGLELCKEIRKSHNYPVIMLTAKDEEIDKIRGLMLGADDYMTKPFRPLDLVARVKAQLRRYKRYNNQSQSVVEEDPALLVHGGLVINIKTHECQLDEKPLNLTPTEFSILKILCQRKGEVVSSEELFHEIWQDEYYSKSNNTITVHIRHLREKMNDSVERPKYIKTIWGVGYKIEN